MKTHLYFSCLKKLTTFVLRQFPDVQYIEDLYISLKPSPMQGYMHLIRKVVIH